jgi:hypothetical protein
MLRTELLFEVEADDTSVEPRGAISIQRHEYPDSWFRLSRGGDADAVGPETLERLIGPFTRSEALAIARERGLEFAEWPSRAHRAFNARLRAALAGEFAAELADGRASLRLDSPDGPAPAMLSVEPANQLAAKLIVQLDDERQVTVYPGRNWLCVEFYSKDAATLEHDVRELASACRSGLYAERVRKRGEMRQGEGRWRTPTGEHRAQLNILFARPRPGRKGWSHVTYEPY